MILCLMEKKRIQENLKHLREELPPGVTLIAVSKTFSFSHIRAAHDAGQRHFGENKVQELEGKAQAARAEGMDIHWHFIGRLQSNKFKKLLAIPGLVAIHSIGSIKQVVQLKKFATEQGPAVKIFLQVNTGQEREKAGLTCLEDLQLAMGHWEGLSHRFPLVGLMTMGAIRAHDFSQEASRCFGHLRAIQEQLGPHLKLSMGMSQDYQIALDHGTDYIRVGSKIFGQRSHD